VECNVLDVDRYLRSESDRAHHGDRVTVPRRILVQHHQRCRCRRPGVLHRLLLEVSSPVRRSVGFLSNSMSRISFHVLNSRSRLTLTGRLHVPIVGPTGRSDWSVRRSYRINVSSDRSDRRSEESNMFAFVRLPIRLSKRVDTTSDWSDRLASRTTNHAAA